MQTKPISPSSPSAGLILTSANLWFLKCDLLHLSSCTARLQSCRYRSCNRGHRCATLSDSPKLLPKKAPTDQILFEQKPEEASDESFMRALPFPPPYTFMYFLTAQPRCPFQLQSLFLAYPLSVYQDPLPLGILTIPKNHTFSLPSHSSAISNDANRLEGVESS